MAKGEVEAKDGASLQPTTSALAMCSVSSKATTSSAIRS
jgi:hypothetical protein